MKNYNQILIRFTGMILSLYLFTGSVYNQVPEKFNYQAVLRDAQGVARTNYTASIQVSVLQGNASGSVVFSETHNVTTNALGMINLEIGSVNSSGFSTIDWSNGPYFIKINVNGTDMGTTQLLSVPYALFAKNAENASNAVVTGNESVFSNWDKDASNDFTGDYDDLSNKPTIPTPVTGTESVFNAWDKNAANDFSGSYEDLTNKPEIVNSQWNTSGSNISYNAGKVGIGTTSPSEKLDVIGNVEVSGVYKFSEDRMEYYQVGCSEFSARNADVGKWALHGDQEYGTFAGISGTWRAFATLHLPQGALVTEVRVYYVDCSTNNMTVYFRRSHSNGIGRDNLGSATSTETDSPSSPVARQMFFNPNTVIDNTDYRYTIIYESEQNNNNHRLYSVRIKYTISHL